MSLRSDRDQAFAEEEAQRKAAPVLRHLDVFRINPDGPVFQLVLAGNGPEGRRSMKSPTILHYSYGYVRVGNHTYQLLLGMKGGAIFRDKKGVHPDDRY